MNAEENALSLLQGVFDPNANYEMFVSVDVDSLDKSGEWTYKDVNLTYQHFSDIGLIGSGESLIISSPSWPE